MASDYACPSCGWPLGSEWCRKSHEIERRQFRHQVNTKLERRELLEAVTALQQPKEGSDG